jgi:hypothetical protein
MQAPHFDPQSLPLDPQSLPFNPQSLPLDPQSLPFGADFLFKTDACGCRNRKEEIEKKGGLWISPYFEPTAGLKQLQIMQSSASDYGRIC